MTICPLIIGGQFIFNGVSMTIQDINYKTCSCACIYYDTCLKKFRFIDIVHPGCKCNAKTT